MKYSAPEAELVAIEISSDILSVSPDCTLDFTEGSQPVGDKLPSFYG